MITYRFRVMDPESYYTGRILVPFLIGTLVWIIGFSEILSEEYGTYLMTIGFLLIVSGGLVAFIQYYWRSIIEINDVLCIKGRLVRKRIAIRNIKSIQILEDLPPRDPSYRFYKRGEILIYVLFVTVFDIWLLFMKVDLIYVILFSLAFCAVLFIPYHLIISRYFDVLLACILGGALNFVISTSQGARITSAIISSLFFSFIFFAVFMLRRRKLARERTLIIKYRYKGKDCLIFIGGSLKKGIMEFHNVLLEKIGSYREEADELFLSETNNIGANGGEHAV